MPFFSIHAASIGILRIVLPTFITVHFRRITHCYTRSRDSQPTLPLAASLCRCLLCSPAPSFDLLLSSQCPIYSLACKYTLGCHFDTVRGCTGTYNGKCAVVTSDVKPSPLSMLLLRCGCGALVTVNSTKRSGTEEPSEARYRSRMTKVKRENPPYDLGC